MELGSSHVWVRTPTDLSCVLGSERTLDLGLLPRGGGPATTSPLHLQVTAEQWAASSPPLALGQVAPLSSAFMAKANIQPLSLSLTRHGEWQVQPFSHARVVSVMGAGRTGNSH